MAPYATPVHEAVTGRFYLDIDNPETDSDGAYSESSGDEGRSLAWRRGLSIAALLSVAGLVGVLGAALFGTPHGPGTGSATARTTAESASALRLDAITTPLPTHAPASEQPTKPWGAKLAADNHVCEEDEELFEGLCYRRCNLLTYGNKPIRSSAWTCCTEHPCGLLNEAADVGKHVVCSGYDINGRGGCPYPGACHSDEEMHLGICYKKCVILTHGLFPNRVAAATCCKSTGLGCLDIRNDKTNFAFAIGDGSGDSDPSTPSGAHTPQVQITAGEESAAIGDAVPTTVAPADRPKALAPVNTSAACAFDEELYGGLCYRKCALLTYGENPIRTSSWTCCRSHPCGLTNQKGRVGHKILCNGYDIAGDGSCPKVPGTPSCGPDEEQLLGVCYKKCSILTKGAYPHRTAAATCCMRSGVSCLNLFKNVKTSDAFNVGGEAKQPGKAFLQVRQ
mmetsp:Transcript_41750/g.108131  ORF Transcript_41750/g.108131 Transcript_41750/m.108131 type:complete len:451 (+) Transcript_41750:86-1438(+)